VSGFEAASKRSAEAALANAGLISLNPPNAPARTFLVSGVARGGTSLLARLFVMAHVPMGETADPVVHEDREIAEALQQSDRGALRTTIASRDAAHAAWGFKRPNLFDLMMPEEVALFRDPALVLVFRDPVAIAQRNVISNRSVATNTLPHAMDKLTQLMRFAWEARCPVLLVSYEKALALPGRLVDGLAAFCGWQISGTQRARMVEAASVDNPIYWRVTRVEVKGFVDRITDGKLYGWCCVVGSNEPVELELLVDGRIVTGFWAEIWRADLAKAGIGNGRHAFSVDVTPFVRNECSIVAVQIKDRDFLLTNSGQTVKELNARSA
jgi:hypothetical protein